MVTIRESASNAKNYGPYKVDGQWISDVISTDTLDFSAYDNTIWKKLSKIETISKEIK